MKVAEARQQLTNEEMELVTEHALATGPFTIEKVDRKDGRVNVTVHFPEQNKNKLIVIPMKVGTSE